jgi:ABC-type nitrate/sulfonate/bicarbonate transport system permease component
VIPALGRTGRAWRSAAPDAVAVAVIVGVWTAVARLMATPTLLPSLPRRRADARRPDPVGSDLRELRHIVLSWLLAALAAIPLGIAMGGSERMDRFVRPFVELFRACRPHVARAQVRSRRCPNSRCRTPLPAS